MADELKALVCQNDVLAVVTKIHGPGCKLLDFEVEKATATVQGFLSTIVRVTARVLVQEQVHFSKFVVKRMPELSSQQEAAIEMGAFEHEIGFFDQCVPTLRKNCPDLPVVDCFHTNVKERVFYMEDLKDLGYVALIRNFPDLKNDLLTMQHIRLVMETLAKFHSASLGTNWREQAPELFELDLVYERGGQSMFKTMIKQSVLDNILPIAEYAFPQNESLLNAVKWYATDECFQFLTKLSKSDPEAINVIGHGDSWANNHMYKIDQETGEPLEIKLIDFQVVRYVPISRDVLYFLYMCTSCEFRKNHEADVIKMYIEAFNENCVKMGRHERLNFDQYYEEFNKCRMYGLIFAVALRHMVYVDGCFPTGDDEVTEENFQNLLDGGTGKSATMKEFARNPVFRNEMIGVITEADATYHKMLIDFK